MSLPVLLYAGDPGARDAWAQALAAETAAQGVALDLRMNPAGVDRGEVEYLAFAAGGPVADFAGFTRLRAVLSLWAGVEKLLALDPPRDVPVVRMVEEGMTLGMVDYVSGHVLRYHLDIDRYVGARGFAAWERDFPPLARERRVGILGLGILGSACARALAAHGFRVSGWSRTPREVPGVETRSGPEGLDLVAAEAEILVLLLPLTEATRRIVDRRLLGLMPRGARLINAGRGPLIDHGALLDALDRGHLTHATMDVFDVEPLPADHRYWSHPRVTVTPHIASATRIPTAAAALVAEIARDLREAPFAHVVARDLGY